MVSFLISVVWICLYSYVMVWMITVIGFTLGIPDTVMGLTFIAAGVSVPDALGGVSVVKEGHGDMAVRCHNKRTKNTQSSQENI